MKPKSIYDSNNLRNQLEYQKSHVWNLEDDIPWSLKIDMEKGFLPLDKDSIAFPNASSKQNLALSQFMGLLVNSTVAEMEDVAVKIRDVAWRQVLDSYPVNPEMYKLGEQFFAEEAKHSLLFKKFNQMFCESNNIDPKELDMLLPKAYGSQFQKAIIKNAKAGGHAFWWVVAMVEEVALLIYQNLYKDRKQIDPLYFQIHKKHFEEESKHTNYAFLMLDLIKTRNKSLKQKVHSKFDLIYSELFSIPWIISELRKIQNVRNFASRNDFFYTLNSCLPLMKNLSTIDLTKRLFVSAPYVSLILNKHHHKLSAQTASSHRAFSLPRPKPCLSKPHIETNSELVNDSTNEDIWSVA